MNDDLISRRALMSHIERENRQWGEDYDTEQILGDIEDFPTAYDVDKVIEKIREYADNVAELGGNFLPQVVIEIVMSGSVADE